MSNSQYLLYDGHGSSRHLIDENYGVDGNGRPFVSDTYCYDGYGVMLGEGSDTAQTAASTGTSLLYSGEQYDGTMDNYYLRARYYNPLNGTFNRMDPYAGNTQDPQSLHKYAYCHANPVNGIDPSGMFSVCEVTVTMAIQSIAMKIVSPFVKPVESIFTQGLLKGLLPVNFFEQLKNSPSTASAIMIGGSLIGVAAKGIAVGFGGGVEVLISPFTGTVGLYGYSEWVIGATRANSGAMATVKAGIVFNAPKLKNYEGSFRSITVPFRLLPSNIRDEIMKRFVLTPWETMTLPKVGDFQAAINRIFAKSKILPQMIDASTQISLFYTPGTEGAWGFSISKMYLPGSSGLWAYGMQNYSLLLGDPDAKLY